MSKRILVVSHNAMLRQTRVALLESAGYLVDAVETDDSAMVVAQTKRPDLVLLGRQSNLHTTGIDERLREAYPDLLILKIEPLSDEHSIHSTRVTSAAPTEVLATIREMFNLGGALRFKDAGQ